MNLSLIGIPKSLQRGQSSLQNTLARIFLWSIVLGTFVSACFGGTRVVNKQLCGLMWTLQLTLAGFVILTSNKKRAQYPYWWWLPWIAWAIIRCDWGDFVAVQRTIMLTACPLIAVAAWLAIDTKEQLEWLLRSFMPIVLIIGPLAILDSRELLPYAGSAPLGGTLTTLCMGACYFSAHAYRAPRKGFLMWAFCVACCAMLRGRMATAVTLLTLPMSPLPYKLRFRSIVIGTVLLLGVGALLLPSMMRKNYRDDLTLSEMWAQRQIFNTDGRRGVWPLFWQEAIKTPVFGAGANADLRLSTSDRDLDGWTHPHNDYLRILLNYGLVGIVLLGIPIARSLIYFFSLIRRTHDSTLRTAWCTAFTGMGAMCLLAITGNVIIYISFFGFYLFAIIGAAHGCRSTQLVKA